MGTPHPNHPFKVYKGIEMREAMIKPTNRPTMPATRVDPGIELMYSALLRQGLKVK
jgi:hypothetical protein